MPKLSKRLSRIDLRAEPTFSNVGPMTTTKQSRVPRSLAWNCRMRLLSSKSFAHPQLSLCHSRPTRRRGNRLLRLLSCSKSTPVLFCFCNAIMMPQLLLPPISCQLHAPPPSPPPPPFHLQIQLPRPHRKRRILLHGSTLPPPPPTPYHSHPPLRLSPAVSQVQQRAHVTRHGREEGRRSDQADKARGARGFHDHTCAHLYILYMCSEFHPLSATNRVQSNNSSPPTPKANTLTCLSIS